jgi:hypothetical protein
MWLNIAAAAVTILTFVAIIRKTEVRLALLTGGLILAVLSMDPQAWSEAFFKSMTVAGLISTILPVMGFAPCGGCGGGAAIRCGQGVPPGPRLDP